MRINSLWQEHNPKPKKILSNFPTSKTKTVKHFKLLFHLISLVLRLLNKECENTNYCRCSRFSATVIAAPDLRAIRGLSTPPTAGNLKCDLCDSEREKRPITACEELSILDPVMKKFMYFPNFRQFLTEIFNPLLSKKQVIH